MSEQIVPIRRRASAQRRPPASAHYAGHSAGIHPEDDPYWTGEQDDLPDTYYQTRAPLSSRRYHSPNQEIIEQGNRRLVIHREPPPRKRKHHFHWLFFVGIGMVVMLAGWVLLTQTGIWWTNQQNTWTYEYPRVYQTNAVVGHKDSPVHPSHFIALNLDGHVQIIEVPGGDASHEKVYIGPIIYNDPTGLTPVTVSFSDVNDDGKPDMLIHIQDQTIIFLNNGSEFQPAR